MWSTTFVLAASKLKTTHCIRKVEAGTAQPIFWQEVISQWFNINRRHKNKKKKLVLCCSCSSRSSSSIGIAIGSNSNKPHNTLVARTTEILLMKTSQLIEVPVQNVFVRLQGKRWVKFMSFKMNKLQQRNGSLLTLLRIPWFHCVCVFGQKTWSNASCLLKLSRPAIVISRRRNAAVSSWRK